jgi:hypothetical protein
MCGGGWTWQPLRGVWLPGRPTDRSRIGETFDRHGLTPARERRNDVAAREKSRVDWSLDEKGRERKRCEWEAGLGGEAEQIQLVFWEAERHKVRVDRRKGAERGLRGSGRWARRSGETRDERGEMNYRIRRYGCFFFVAFANFFRCNFFFGHPTIMDAILKFCCKEEFLLRRINIEATCPI